MYHKAHISKVLDRNQIYVKLITTIFLKSRFIRINLDTIFCIMGYEFSHPFDCITLLNLLNRSSGPLKGLWESHFSQNGIKHQIWPIGSIELVCSSQYHPIIGKDLIVEIIDLCFISSFFWYFHDHFILF